MGRQRGSGSITGAKRKRIFLSSIEYLKSNSESIYELSGGGKTLTVTQTIDTPFAVSQTVKKVFDRTTD